MKDAIADAFRGKLEEGQIIVEFGQSQEPEPGEAACPVMLSDRIAMPPHTAKRLVLALNDTLRRHARRLEAATSASGDAELIRRGRTPVNAPPDTAGEKAALLLRLVSDLGTPYQYERSFRMSEGELSANRYLLTIDKRDIPGDPLERTLEICRQLDVPPAFEVAAEQNFDITKCVHFGFEGGSNSIVCKLYLEIAIAADRAERAKARSEPLLQHLAFKWDIVNNLNVVTRYHWYPGLPAQDIEHRLTQVYRGGEPQFSFEIAKSVLHEAAGRTAAERLQYLEVQEDENDRRSFDLNLYNADMQVKDLQRVLNRMRMHYGIRPGQFQALYDQVKTKRLGHLAGGVHRNGKDFFNVYYGVAGFPRFVERF